ncbi:hypothetical protein [Lentisalinibacter sediminis]|uniref:hypothetical protein n=1 Tax=Lentisalinibacter sediminis TaxID=2992237 RepID=UPI00386C5F9B
MGEPIAADADVALLADAVIGGRGVTGDGNLAGQNRDQRDRRAAGQESCAQAEHPDSLTNFRAA